MRFAPVARSRSLRRALIWLASAMGTTLGGSIPDATRVEAGDPVPVESVAAVEAEWGLLERPTRPDVRRFLQRFRAAIGGEARARELATRMIRDFDVNDEIAHEILGHKEFAYEVPEEISYRRYPFVRIVEEAGVKRWFDDLVPYTAALEAYAKCTTHAKRLAEEPAYAALDVARRGIDLDEHLHSYNYDAVFASPYLICYSTRERIDEAAMWNMSRAEKSRAWAELDSRRVGYKRVLAEKARIYTQVYREFLKRYGEACDLKPLMDPFGGRPDYPAGRRSYREGCPLVVWVFSDHDAWRDYHEGARRVPIWGSASGYHSSDTGRIYSHDRALEDRDGEIAANTEAAVSQLLHWFARQRDEWGAVHTPQTWFSRGFPAWFGAVTMSKDRSLAFVGVSRNRLGSLKSLKDHLSRENRKLFVFPLKELTSFQGYGNVQAWGVQQWGINPGFVFSLFDKQSWALAHFLNVGADGKYRPAFDRFVNVMLLPPRESPDYVATTFRKEFAIGTDDDWKRMQKEFDRFYAELIKRDPDTVAPIPPALDDWPDYVAPDLEAPTGPPIKK